MAKKAARKDSETCPKCGKRADCLIEFADGTYKAVHGFKWTETRSAATGKMIACQVEDKICTNMVEWKPALVEEAF